MRFINSVEIVIAELSMTSPWVETAGIVIIVSAGGVTVAKVDRGVMTPAIVSMRASAPIILVL